MRRGEGGQRRSIGCSFDSIIRLAFRSFVSCRPLPAPAFTSSIYPPPSPSHQAKACFVCENNRRSKRRKQFATTQGKGTSWPSAIDWPAPVHRQRLRMVKSTCYVRISQPHITGHLHKQLLVAHRRLGQARCYLLHMGHPLQHYPRSDYWQSSQA